MPVRLPWTVLSLPDLLPGKYGGHRLVSHACLHEALPHSLEALMGASCGPVSRSHVAPHFGSVPGVPAVPGVPGSRELYQFLGARFFFPPTIPIRRGT